jgi:hypothetical protein
MAKARLDFDVELIGHLTSPLQLLMQFRVTCKLYVQTYQSSAGHTPSCITNKPTYSPAFKKVSTSSDFALCHHVTNLELSCKQGTESARFRSAGCTLETLHHLLHILLNPFN